MPFCPYCPVLRLLSLDIQSPMTYLEFRSQKVFGNKAGSLIGLALPAMRADHWHASCRRDVTGAAIWGMEQGLGRPTL
ncbi:hypothetical protein ACRALDRAFT_207991 [Sodiomyces alcalophilus JCM 7366]|uniref:uncharacterized protein n=1 Tax=Sodiomyces alcalophilus JCM 7366 TaxID=591952 RepID=UPI0039B600DE